MAHGEALQGWHMTSGVGTLGSPLWYLKVRVGLDGEVLQG